MNLAELVARVKASGAARPLDAVEIGHTAELGVCAGGCGHPCGMLIDGLQLHMKCFLDQFGPARAQQAAAATGTAARPDGPSTRGDSQPAKSKSPSAALTSVAPAARAGSDLRLAAVLDRRGLWLPEQGEPVDVGVPSGMAELHELGILHGVRQVWVHPSAHDMLGLPARDLLKVGPADPVDHDFVVSDQVRCDPAGLTAWCNTSRADGTGRRVAVVLPGYESRCAWRRAADGPSLLAAVTGFDRALKADYYLSPNETGLGLLRSAATSNPAALGAGDMPEPAGELAQSHLWSRHLLEEEDDDEAWLHRWDLNGAQPAVFGGIFVATGPYRHHAGIEFQAARDKNTAGYWLLNIPRDGHGLDPRLPDLLKPLREADARAKSVGEPAWFATDSVVLLAELGVPFTVVEAWLAESSARVLRTMNERYRAARTGLLAQSAAGDAGAGLAYEVLKSVFTSRIGDFAREGSRVFRPDFRDAILARAAANQYRAIRGVALGRPATKTRAAVAGSGRFPVATYEDAVYYVSVESDPALAAAKIGLPIETPKVRELGRYSHEASLPMAVMREHIGTRGFHRGFTRALRGTSRERG